MSIYSVTQKEMTRREQAPLVGDSATGPQLAIYRHYVRNSRVPASIPAWAKKKAQARIIPIPKGPIYPRWTYKKAMVNIPSKIPEGRPGTMEVYIVGFDILNNLIHIEKG